MISQQKYCIGDLVTTSSARPSHKKMVWINIRLF